MVTLYHNISIKLLYCITLYLPHNATAQRATTYAPNLIVITTDGLRWQELYQGIDTAIAHNPTYNQGDSVGIYNAYNNKPIMPFVTNTISKYGQLWGNRSLGNNVQVSNPYWFSYPGYSELLCGLVDDSINRNTYANNPHRNILDYLHQQPAYRGKVAAFGAWYAFRHILHKPTAKYPITAAFDTYTNPASSQAALLNKLNNEAYKPFDTDECLDVITHNMALDYLKTKQPKVLYIAYGETDEWAHEGKYKAYLHAAAQVDKYIQEIWNYVQSNVKYKGNTILLITTDHGRGIGNEWTNHNSKTQHSNETWFAIMGPGIPALGVRAYGGNYYTVQLTHTLLQVMQLPSIQGAKHNAIDIKN